MSEQKTRFSHRHPMAAGLLLAALIALLTLAVLAGGVYFVIGVLLRCP